MVLAVGKVSMVARVRAQERAPSPDELDDIQLVRRVVEGSREEYQYIVERHQSMIFGLVYRQVASHDLACELTQEIFTRVYFNLAQFRGEAKFSTWLIRIAINAVNTFLVSKRYRNARKTSSIDLIQGLPHATDPGAEHAALKAEEATQLRGAIMDLPQDLREVVVLCGLEQRAWSEVAEILAVPEGTVCSRMNRAFAQLRKKLTHI